MTAASLPPQGSHLVVPCVFSVQYAVNLEFVVQFARYTGKAAHLEILTGSI